MRAGSGSGAVTAISWPSHLALDVGLDALLHVVVVLGRLEGLDGDLIDELLGQLQLGSRTSLSSGSGTSENGRTSSA